MDREFSVDEFWSAEAEAEAEAGGESKSKSKMMNRCSSEWEFQRFLQESSSKSKDDEKSHQITPNPNPNPSQEDYQAFLKTRLNLACAAVAFTRTSCAKPLDSAVLPENAPQTSNTCQLGSQIPSKGSSYYQSKGQDKDVCGSLGISSLPSLQQKAAVEVKSTTSGSSRDQSDDDELEGETATTQNGDPSDARRVRRMLSNRESARRSRRRKQAHLSELEGQVSQVKVENSSLLKRLTDINNKYSEAAVDNRILKADVETLRAKVKMAEETVKRVTGLNPMFHAMSDISTIGMPSFACSPSDTSIDTAVPMREDDPKHHHLYHHQPTSSNHISPH